VVGSFAGGYSGDRFGRYRMGVVVLLAVAALMVLFPYSTGLWALAAAYAVYRCLQAAFMPLMNSMIAAHSSPEHRSLSFSINFVAVNVFGAVVPTATSVLIERYYTTVIFPISIVALVPTMGLILLLGKMRKN